MDTAQHSRVIEVDWLASLTMMSNVELYLSVGELKLALERSQQCEAEWPSLVSASIRVRLPTLGGSLMTRDYGSGQYHDRKITSVQAELPVKLIG